MPATSRYKNFLKIWKTKLQGFYDAEFVINGVSHGFYLQLQGNEKFIDKRLGQAKRFFFPFTAKQKSAITDWLLQGVHEGYISGPFEKNFKFPFELHISPLFVVPKPKLDEWRTIWHGSWKDESCFSSLNELIDEKDKNVRYISTKEIARMLLVAIKQAKELKQQAHLYALDAYHAYYSAPLHPCQYKYMGMQWLNQYWLFKSLQMGLGSACRTYTRFADAIEFVIVKENKEIMFLEDIQLMGHYLDDFFGAQPSLERATIAFNASINTFEELNVPTTPAKQKTPQVSRKWLGRCYDTRFDGVVAPSQRQRYKALSYLLYIKKSCIIYKKQSEKVNGVLGNIAELYYPAKAFLRRFQAIISDPRLSYEQGTRVDQFFLGDIDLWIHFLSNPELLYQKLEYLVKNPDDNDDQIATDASGVEGAGGVWFNKKLAFQVRWSDTIYYEVLKERPELKIHAQETIGAWIAFDLWGEQLSGKAVTVYNDNPAAASALITKAPPLYRTDLQCIIRDIALKAMMQRFMFWGVKIDGKVNDYADALSRFKPYPWKKLGYTIIDATDSANKILSKLLFCGPNLDEKRWKWLPHQRKMLNIDVVEKRLANNNTGTMRRKQFKTNRNILTKCSFDDEP